MHFSSIQGPDQRNGPGLSSYPLRALKHSPFPREKTGTRLQVRVHNLTIDTEGRAHIIV